MWLQCRLDHQVTFSMRTPLNSRDGICKITRDRIVLKIPSFAWPNKYNSTWFSRIKWLPWSIKMKSTSFKNELRDIFVLFRNTSLFRWWRSQSIWLIPLCGITYASYPIKLCPFYALRPSDEIGRSPWPMKKSITFFG